MTAFTLGWASAAEVSMLLMRAWASGTAQDGAVQHPRQLQVVDVVALAADEARVFLAPHPPEADRVGAGLSTSSSAHPLGVSAGCSAAHRMARTMFS